MTIAPITSSILLGYTIPAAGRNPIGFGVLPQTPFAAREVRYDGDAPLITVAPTGAGKGVSAVIPTALTYPGPMVIVDPKGEVFGVTAEARRRMGHKVVCIAPFSTQWEHAGGTSQTAIGALNPLDLIDLRSDVAVDDVQSLATAMTGSLIGKDPFWDECARQVIAAMILWIKCYAPEGAAHLGTLRRMVNQAKDDLNATLTAMQASAGFNRLAAEGANLLSNMAELTHASVVATVRAHLAFLSSSNAVASLASSSVTIREIVDGDPVSIYIVLPPERLESHRKLLRLWLTTIISAISRRTARPDLPTLLLIDEAAQLGELDALRTAVTLMRGYGLTTWTFWQSVAQMQRVYPDFGSLLDNAGVIQVFGASNAPAARAIEEITGYSGEIVGISRDSQILCLPGQPPILSQKLNYLRELRFQKHARPNPYYARTGEQPRHAAIESAHIAEGAR
jgi:type IV secretion system protein VirD4